MPLLPPGHSHIGSEGLVHGAIYTHPEVLSFLRDAPEEIRAQAQRCPDRLFSCVMWQNESGPNVNFIEITPRKERRLIELGEYWREAVSYGALVLSRYIRFERMLERMRAMGWTSPTNEMQELCDDVNQEVEATGGYDVFHQEFERMTEATGRTGISFIRDCLKRPLE